MHQFLSFLVATTTTTAASSKKSSGSSLPLLFLIVIFAGAYFLFIRPRQQRMRQQQTAARQLAVGDEVVTAGGIHGRVIGLEDDTVQVEVSPGVVLTVLRRAVNPRPGSGATGTSSSGGSPEDHEAYPDGTEEENHDGGDTSAGPSS